MGLLDVQCWSGCTRITSFSELEELAREPGSAFYGAEVGCMNVGGKTVLEEIADLLLEAHKQQGKRSEKGSGQLETREPLLGAGLSERIKELESMKKSISDEMDHLVRAFSLGGAGSRAIGCLRLEEVHTVKNNRRYGPYGPYYYLYLHRTGKLEKRYLGKSAERFKVRRDAIVKLRQLETEYKRILKLERQLAREARHK